MADILYEHNVKRMESEGNNAVPFVIPCCLGRMPYLKYHEKAEAGLLE